MGGDKQAYDVVVVGSGAAGGMAVKVLTEGGAKVLLLEAGPDLTDPGAAEEKADGRPSGDRLGALVDKARTVADLFRESVGGMSRLALGRPDVAGLGHLRSVASAPKDTFRPERQVVQRNCRGYGPGTKMLYVDDVDHPYTTPAHQPFVWIRGRQLGGRTQTWKRVAPRMTDSELSAPRRDGHGEPWPLTYADLRPHYEAAERVLRVIGPVEAGAEPYEGALAQRPMAPAERSFVERCSSRWPERRVVLCPFASPLGPDEDPSTLDARINAHPRGRWPAYDCSVRHSIPFARKTGRLEVRTGAVVREVTHEGGRATGVAYVDAKTNELVEVRAKFVVLAASTLESTRILLLSGDGFANSSGALGRYLIDHLFGVGVVGISDEPYEPKGFPELFVHPFRNTDRDPERHGFIRSYQLYGEISALRAGPMRRWVNSLTLSAQGEVLPQRDNRVRLNPDLVDAFGIPSLEIQYARSDNELAMAEDMLRTTEEMAEAAGYRILMRSPTALLPGWSVHELGTARMGADPKKSVLDAHCRSWDVPNLYVTDGAAFPTSASQNPTLTIMALTHRACVHLLGQLGS